jgi:hypothetical protein
MIGFFVFIAVSVLTSFTVFAVDDVSYSQNATMTIQNFCSNQSSAGSGDYQANVGCVRNPIIGAQPLEYIAWCSVTNGIVVANVTTFYEQAYTNCTVVDFYTTDYEYNAPSGQCAVSYVAQDYPIYNATVTCVAFDGQNNSAALQYNLVDLINLLILCVIVATMSQRFPM